MKYYITLLFVLPVLVFSQTNSFLVHTTKKNSLTFKNTLTFMHNQRHSKLKVHNRSEGEEKGRLFFYNSVGLGVLAIGQDQNLDFSAIESVGLHAYYAPKMAFRINYENIAFLGSNVQMLFNEDLGFVVVFPVTLGLSHCLSSSDDDDDLGFWVFADGGLGTALFLSTDPADDALTNINGPYVDLGLRLGDWEIKASLLKAFKNTNDGFIMGVGVGLVF